MTCEKTNTQSPDMVIDTWVNPSFIVSIELVTPFGEYWCKGVDYIIVTASGTEFQCVGNVIELIDQINRTLVPYSLN